MVGKLIIFNVQNIFHGKKAVIGIICYQGKVLVGKKRSDSSKFFSGKWHLLGENVEGAESDEVALARGAREEVGLAIRVGAYLGSFRTPTGKLGNFYECFADDDSLTVGSDLEDARWVTKEEARAMCKERMHL